MFTIIILKDYKAITKIIIKQMTQTKNKVDPKDTTKVANILSPGMLLILTNQTE